MKDRMSIMVLNQRKHERRPVLYVQIWYGNSCIDQGTNVAILKAKYKNWPVKIKYVR